MNVDFCYRQADRDLCLSGGSGFGNDIYAFLDLYGNDTIIENPGEGSDTMDFTFVTVPLEIRLGSVTVTDGSSEEQLDDVAEAVADGADPSSDRQSSFGARIRLDRNQQAVNRRMEIYNMTPYQQVRTERPLMSLALCCLCDRFRKLSLGTSLSTY